ncbi:hypothetical protein [Amycolatopsis sp. NPDC051372]|uniref:hypothetical protein n=1 Tax=Amycolatopsis sp. NPDC051372 TaxID=3155669 RepID=UPI00342E3DE8
MRRVLMGQRRSDVHEALALLLSPSRHTNTKLRDVAGTFLDNCRADLPQRRLVGEGIGSASVASSPVWASPARCG